MRGNVPDLNLPTPVERGDTVNLMKEAGSHAHRNLHVSLYPLSHFAHPKLITCGPHPSRSINECINYLKVSQFIFFVQGAILYFLEIRKWLAMLRNTSQLFFLQGRWCLFTDSYSCLDTTRERVYVAMVTPHLHHHCPAASLPGLVNVLKNTVKSSQTSLSPKNAPMFCYIEIILFHFNRS